ncbi:MAG: cryptochrome/photolyase family protein [Anaerolineaceae bacterium]
MNIWWIRRDLRLEDNHALAGAMRDSNEVIPVFILDEDLLAISAAKRQSFLFAGLASLDRDLQKLGSRLIVRKGNPLVEIPKLVNKYDIKHVYAEEDISPYAIRRDNEIAKLVPLQLTAGLGVHPANAVTKPDGTPYTVFTPYSRAWKALPFNSHTLPAPGGFISIPHIPGEEIPIGTEKIQFKAGEQEAWRRFEDFLNGPIHVYEFGRNQMDVDGTSSLSPYFRFGMLSVRKVVAEVQRKIQNTTDPAIVQSCATWINELIWREFYQSILYRFPSVLATAFKPKMRDIPWRNAPDDLLAWKAGLTGFPVVDAGMRQLKETGWMHNRARMIVASFLVKDLLINWQEGESWFKQLLIDGDPASNNGGWQWVAGTGTDAAPYFRIFNPVSQGKKFDPKGNYVRRWVPELRNLPDQFIHEPWEMPISEQQKVNVIIGKDYPDHIVDHANARERVLDAYSSNR